MLEQIVTGLSKTVIFGTKEATKGIITAKKELNPAFLKSQAGAIAKFELMKAQYIKANGSGTASIDALANQKFAEWLQTEKEQSALAEEMMASFTTTQAPQPAQQMYTAEEVQQMLAQLQAQKESQAV